jgi:rhamnose transport system permease protein
MTELTPTSAPEAQSTTLVNEFPPKKSFLARFQRWEWMLALLLLAVIVLNSNLSPFFLNAVNMFRTSSDFMEIGLMMLPMVFIILTGNIDLSVASNMGMSASLMGLLFNNGADIWVAALAGLVLGTLGGLLNGYLVAKVKIPSLVVTLGTYAFFRGLAYGFLGDQAATNYPPAFNFLGQGKIFGSLVPFSVGLFLVLAVVFGLVLHRTTFGRYLKAVGNSENTSAYSGIRVARIRMINYTISGFMAAMAGLILAARFGSTRPDIGTGLELSVITAAVLGGVDINGGKGTMVGAVMSLILIGLMTFGMGLLNIQGQVQGVVIGLLLILSILLPTLARNIFKKNTRLNPRSLGIGLIFVVIFALFFAFFFWSRTLGVS